MINSNVVTLGTENQYQIVLDKQIGGGKFGSVYDCVQNNGNRQALKKLCAKIIQVSPQRNFQKNTQREEQILRILKANPNNFNLVKVEYVQFFEKEAKLVIIMEKCDMNLKKMLNQKQTFSPEEIFDFLQQFLAGYKALYDCNIKHRDIKPENILIKKKFDGKPQFKLADFGVGKIYKLNDFVFNTNTISIVGTPFYSAPEVSEIYNDQQLQNEFSTMKDKKCCIDMYSLGIILYQLTFAELPFVNAQHLVQFFQRIRVQPFKPPHYHGSNQEILNLIESLLIYYPSKRLHFDQLYQKYFLQPRQINPVVFNTFQLNEAFEEVKMYLQKYLQYRDFIIRAISSNLLCDQVKNQFYFILQSQQWNQNFEWIFNCFQFQKLYSQHYNEQDLSFFISLLSLKNKQAYQLYKNKEQMINFLSK